MSYTTYGQDYLFLWILTVRTRSLNFQLWNVIRVIGYAFVGPSYLASVLKYILLLKA
jgi:hypothetical protein